MESKILLIDNDKSYVDFFQERLRTERFEVEIAVNATAAYEKIFTFVPDLIISSNLLEEVDGFQFCKLLKNDNIFKKIPYMILAKEVEPIHKFWAQKNEVQSIFPKETPFEEIRLNIGELMEEFRLDDEIKEKIRTRQISSESVQSQVLTILNNMLTKSAFLNEFRDMVSEYYTEEKVLVQNTFELLSVFLNYNLGGMFFNHAQETNKYLLYCDVKDCSVSNFVIEKVKRDFFSKMPNIKEFSITSFGHEIINENDENFDNRIISANEFESFIILPFELEEKLIGGVCFYSKTPQDFTKFRFYDILVNELTALFKMSYLFSGIEFLSVTDGLTGLSNRRQFDYSIKREFVKSKRYPSDLSFAILDIDFFKKVNDTYGHQYGDYVLREVSSILKNSFRKSDMLYRYGGEEIAIIMTETTIPTAMTIMERLRKKIEIHEFIYNGIQINVTVSIGIGSNLDRFDEAHQMIECADKALYKAKQTGRNKVVTYSDEENNQ